MKDWQLYPKISNKTLLQYPDINPLILQLLFNRGITEKKNIDIMLKNHLDDDKTVVVGTNEQQAFFDPFLFQDMKKAIDMIISHIKQKNKIIIYGDYDADGVTSSAVLFQSLKILKASVDVYLPDRVNEGYGLNKQAIEKLAQQETKLIITVDNGTRNKEEVALAKSLGIDIIITDHHILPPQEDLPDCYLINPSNPNDTYPWAYLSGVGVTFKVVSALLIKSKLTAEDRQKIIDKLLDLVAIGTVADLVNILGENRLLVTQGLLMLNKTKCLGIKELIKIAKLNNRKLESWNISWQLAPRLNAASRMGSANAAFELLISNDAQEAKKLAEDLDQKNLKRQAITKEIFLEVEEQIDPNNIPNIIIGITDEEQSWNEGILGLVAGRISEKYYRPVLVITRLKDDSGKLIFKGSGRSIPDLDLIVTLESCKEFLHKYGGHPMACGFSIKGENNLNAFVEKLNKVVDEKLKDKKLVPKLKIEAELKMSDINLQLLKNIESLAPFGQNNRQPCFVSYHLLVDDIMLMGLESQHIKLKVDNFWAISFASAEKYQNIKIGDYIDLAYHLDINNFKGKTEVQLKIIDIKQYD